MHESIKYISYKESPIRFYDKGKGRAVVLLHGFLESMEIWEDYAAELSKRFRVICIDLPGHGQSGCLGYIHTMDMMAECVQAVLKQLRIRSSAIIGHSMGGYVAMAYAEIYPDKVKGLCLFHSTAAADNEVKKKDRDRLIALVKQSKKDLVRQMIPNLFTKENRKKYSEEVKALIKAARKTPKQGIIAALEGMKERREREIILRFSTYPVSFIIGRHDPVVPFEKIMEQVELPSNAMYHVLEETAHMGFIEAKEECYEMISDFAKISYNAKK
ncbi:MAG: alpha/beta hydrolase [Bacteroidetes bacterium]|nr:alpha/beta hydrolase [Bacteroidota bacterium]